MVGYRFQPAPAGAFPPPAFFQRLKGLFNFPAFAVQLFAVGVAVGTDGSGSDRHLLPEVGQQFFNPLGNAGRASAAKSAGSANRRMKRLKVRPFPLRKILCKTPFLGKGRYEKSLNQTDNGSDSVMLRRIRHQSSLMWAKIYGIAGKSSRLCPFDIRSNLPLLSHSYPVPAVQIPNLGVTPQCPSSPGCPCLPLPLPC